MVAESLASRVSYFGKEEATHFYPAWMKWDIDIPQDKTPVALFYEAAQKFSDQSCIDFMGKKLTYREVREAVDHAAVGLVDRGIGAGQKVGLLMPNTPYYPIMFLAVQRAGATAVNLSYAENIDIIRNNVAESETTAIVTTDLERFYAMPRALQKEGTLKGDIVLCPFAEMLPPIKKQLFPLKARGKMASVESSDSVLNFGNLIDNDGDIERRIPLSSIKLQDIALLQYTSGSTGKPKGAMLSHFNLAANITQIKEMTEIRADRPRLGGQIGAGTKELGVLPYFHIYGMQISMMLPMLTGAEVHIVPDPRDYRGIKDTMLQNGLDIAPLLPGQMACIANLTLKEKGKLKATFKEAMRRIADCFGAKKSSHIAVISGGEKLPVQVEEAFKVAFPKKTISIHAGFGMSETSPVQCFAAAGVPKVAGSVGVPAPLTEIKLVDEDDHNKIVPWGEAGVLCVKGPQVMGGYYKQQDRTDQVLSADGWLSTGDLARFDAFGQIHIEGRNDRSGKINGEKVSCDRIEEAMMQHPAVAECVAVWSRRSGGAFLAVKAFVVYKDDPEIPRPIDRAAWYDFLTDKERGTLQLSHTEAPYFVVPQAEPLLRNGTGKIDWKRIEAAESQNTPSPLKEGLTV